MENTVIFPNVSIIITSIKDERIRLYKAGRIGINGKIKNIVLGKVSGELIAFIDHDLWAPEKPEKQVIALQEYPDAGFSLTGGYNFKIKEELLEFFYKQRNGVRFDNIFLSAFRSEIAIWTQALLIRRQCIETAGPFNVTTKFADPEFIIRLAYHFKAVVLYEPLMYHRLHDKNYSVLNWITSHLDGITVIRSFENKKMLLSSLARDVLFKSTINFGENVSGIKKRDGIKSFFDAWKQNPFSIIPIKKPGKQSCI